MKVRTQMYFYLLVWFIFAYVSVIIASIKNNIWFFSGAFLALILLVWRMWTIRCPKCQKPVSGGLGRIPIIFTPMIRDPSYRSILNPRCKSCGYYLKNEEKKDRGKRRSVKRSAVRDEET